MNICFFAGNMGDMGGTEKMTQLLANKLCEQDDNNIFVLSKSNLKINPSFALSSKINYSNLDNGRYIKIYSLIKDVFLLSKFVKKNNIDVLVNVDVSLGMFSLPLKILRPKLKQVFWEHFCVLYNINNKFTDRLRKLALKLADAYVVLTPDDKAELKKQGNIRARVLNIPNICTYQISGNFYKTDSKIILSVGNLISVKGFDLALEVAKKVFTKHPDWSWHIYGSGSEEKNLKLRVAELSLENNVEFMGKTQDLAGVYKKASIFVLTSRSEGFGLVLIEAQAHNLPTIAFDVPYGPRNIIDDGINGYLIESFDVDDMAKKICELIENPDTLLRFSQNANINLDKYNVENVSKEWEELLGGL